MRLIALCRSLLEVHAPSFYGLAKALRKRQRENLRRKVRFRDLPARHKMTCVGDNSVYEAVDRSDLPGVNVFGYLHGEFGLGTSVRSYSTALRRLGCPLSLLNVEVPNVGQPGHSWEAVDSRDSAPYPIDLVFVNPDFFAHVPLHPGNYVIGFWFWELERVPLDWLDAIDAVDEIWVATEYVAHAFRSVTQKPVIVVPHPVPIPLGPVGGIEKPDFDLDPSSFSFLFSFDFNSWVERKNPWAVISAFESAFPRGDEPVQLLIKSSNGVCHAQALRRLLRRVRKDRRIVVRDQILGQNLVDGLQWTVDAYVSLHRAEGFGLGMAEMMAKGKPVAATAWSGNCDYMDETCAGMIGYRLVQVGTDDYLGDGGVWADADVQEAASWMAHISQDRCAAKSLGDAARQAITDRLSVERAVEVMGGRLREIGLLLSSNSSN